jgi:Na+/H+ antiporter NhaD/arsenite permease-like protein
MKTIFIKLQQFIKAEIVLSISCFAAILTMFFIKPSSRYLSYLDFRVLALLFCLMAVVAGFNKTGVFLVLSEKLLKKVSTTRSLSFVLVMLCFFTSMWITNDVALITFVPFSIMILSMIRRMNYLIKVVVLQTIAANLGSMLTPVGNPQNLYLYSFYEIPIGKFLQITVPFTAASFFLLCICSFFIKKEPLELELTENKKTDRKRSYFVVMYSFLFLICLACVLRLLDYRAAFLIVLLTTVLFDRSVLKKVDYFLLLTFVCFFIFVGNIGTIEIVREFLAKLLSGRELPVSIAASQVISNVPAAVLLSAFTKDYRALILGTDLGGLGTLVASLASLISYKFYCKTEEAKPGKYLGIFTLYNILFLGGLYIFYFIV